MGDTPGQIQEHTFDLADDVEALIVSPVSLDGISLFRFQYYVDQIEARLGLLLPELLVEYATYTAGTAADKAAAKADKGWKGKGQSDSKPPFNDLFLVIIRARL